MTKIYYGKSCLHLILGHFTAKIIIDTWQSVKAVVEENALAGPFSDYCVFVIVSISKLSIEEPYC